MYPALGYLESSRWFTIRCNGYSDPLINPSCFQCFRASAFTQFEDLKDMWSP